MKLPKSMRRTLGLVISGRVSSQRRIDPMAVPSVIVAGHAPFLLGQERE